MRYTFTVNKSDRGRSQPPEGTESPETHSFAPPQPEFQGDDYSTLQLVDQISQKVVMDLPIAQDLIRRF